MSKTSNVKSATKHGTKKGKGMSKAATAGRGISKSFSGPASESVIVYSQNPTMSHSYVNGRSTTTVTHREFIADVYPSINFNIVQALYVNPANPICFPWLSSIAGNYETYCFDKLRFLRTTDVSTTYIGSFYMAMDYDALDTLPSDKSEVMAHAGASRAVVWQEQVFDATKSDLHKMKERYIRQHSDEGTETEDIRVSDVGRFIVGSSGASITSIPYGELYVEYTVKLFTPQLDKASSLYAVSKAFTGTPPNDLSWAANALTKGGLPVNVNSTNNGFVFATTGSYLVNLNITGTTISAVPPVSGSVLVLGSYYTRASLNTSYTAWYVVKATSPGGILGFNMTGFTLSAFACVIAKFDESLALSQYERDKFLKEKNRPGESFTRPNEADYSELCVENKSGSIEPKFNYRYSDLPATVSRRDRDRDDPQSSQDRHNTQPPPPNTPHDHYRAEPRR